MAASLASSLNKAAVARDGVLPRREIEPSNRAASKRQSKPCSLEEAIDDTRSHLEDSFLHEDWQPFTVSYDVRKHSDGDVFFFNSMFPAPGK